MGVRSVHGVRRGGGGRGPKCSWSGERGGRGGGPKCSWSKGGIMHSGYMGISYKLKTLFSVNYVCGR